MGCSELSGHVGAGFNPVWAVALAVIWLVTVRMLTRRRRAPAFRAGTLTFAFLASAATLTGYQTRIAINSGLHVPDVTILISDLLLIASIASALRLAAAVNNASPRQRQQLRFAQLFLAVAAVTLVVLFFLIPRRLDHPDFGCWQGSSTLVVSYQLLVQACLAAALVMALILFTSHWRDAPRPLNLALLILSIGCWIGIAYAIARVWNILWHGFGLPYFSTTSPLFNTPAILIETSVLFIGIGAALSPGYRLIRFLARYLRYQRLRPLWATLTEACPHTVLGPVPTRRDDLLTVRSIERRLYRRVIEIRDVQWELTRFLTDTMVEQAREATHGQEPAFEALLLTIAYHARQEQASGGDHPGAENEPQVPPAGGQADMNQEVRVLLGIQRLFDRS